MAKSKSIANCKGRKRRITKSSTSNNENNLDHPIKRAKLNDINTDVNMIIETKDHQKNVNSNQLPTTRKRKLHGLSKKDKDGLKMLNTLRDLPVVVCVAMYRSNGVLEKNVANVGRVEGFDLWHFS